MSKYITKSAAFVAIAKYYHIRTDFQLRALSEALLDVHGEEGKWFHVNDNDYSGGGYTECSACHWRLSDGAYHEPHEFRFCPHCGAEMEVEDDLVEVVRCRDCVFFKRDDDTWAQVCTKAYAWDDENWFCADGRKE